MWHRQQSTIICCTWTDAVQAGHGGKGRHASSSQQGSSTAKQSMGQREQAVPLPILLSRAAYQMLVEQVRLIALHSVDRSHVQRRPKWLCHLWMSDTDHFISGHLTRKACHRSDLCTIPSSWQTESPYGFSGTYRYCNNVIS